MTDNCLLFTLDIHIDTDNVCFQIIIVPIMRVTSVAHTTSPMTVISIITVMGEVMTVYN